VCFAGTTQVDAHNVMLSLCEFSYVSLPFGIATAATIRVGNMLGAGDHATAKRSGVSLQMQFGLTLIKTSPSQHSEHIRHLDLLSDAQM
jgi:Na+-driven multidrug efflux pump